MKAKEYLRRYLEAKERINHLESEILELRRRMTSTSKPESVSHSSNPSTASPQEKYLGQIIEREEAYFKEMLECFDLMRLLSAQIDAIADPYKKLLRARYIDGDRLEKIAMDMDYSYTRVRHMHAEGLRLFDEKFMKLAHDSTF